jgi:hypothetical protein
LLSGQDIFDWYSNLNPAMPLHGLAVVDAADLNTGHAVDCPITAAEFLPSIVWEDYSKRLNPERPNKDWIQKFGTGWGFGDGKPRYYTMEEA